MPRVGGGGPALPVGAGYCSAGVGWWAPSGRGVGAECELCVGPRASWWGLVGCPCVGPCMGPCELVGAECEPT